MGATGFLRGPQKQGPTSGHHAAAPLFGAVALATGDVLISQAEQATTTTLTAFLDTIREAFPGKAVHLILDHAKIPHAKVLQPDLADHPALTGHCLPPDSPNLNHTARLGTWWQEKVLLNRALPDLAAIQQAMDDFVRWLPDVPHDIHSRLCRLPVS